MDHCYQCSSHLSSKSRFQCLFSFQHHCNRRAYDIQRNCCVSLIRKTKRDYHSNLNHKQVTDNKYFWETIKPFFTDKGVTNEKITLAGNGETLPKNEEIAENLDNYFSDIITNRKLLPYEDPTTNPENIVDPVLKAIEKYKNHANIRIINDKCKTNSVFTFNQVSLEYIQKELKNLNPSKVSQSSDIVTKIIRQNLDLFAPLAHQEMNESLDLNKFPSTMKLGNIIPSFKKNYRTNKANYRPVSILLNLSKVF